MRHNQIKIPGYQVFEQIRRENKTSGGGLLTAVHNDLEPVLVSEGTDEAEIIVVEAKIANNVVRFINGYGKQEKDMKK